MIKSLFKAASIVLLLGAPSGALAQKGLTGAQLTDLTGKGITLKLGGAGQGYEGTLKLSANGNGKGSAVTDAGNKISIVGTWTIEGDKFCRVWKDLDEGQEVCETWVPTSDRSVDVYNGKRKIGVNSW